MRTDFTETVLERLTKEVFLMLRKDGILQETGRPSKAESDAIRAACEATVEDHADDPLDDQVMFSVQRAKDSIETLRALDGEESPAESATTMSRADEPADDTPIKFKKLMKAVYASVEKPEDPTAPTQESDLMPHNAGPRRATNESSKIGRKSNKGNKPKGAKSKALVQVTKSKPVGDKKVSTRAGTQTVDPKAVDAAAETIREAAERFAREGMTAMHKIGETIFNVSYGGDIDNYQSRKANKGASLRVLAEKAGLSDSFLSECVMLYLRYDDLPEVLRKQLPPSSQVRLLRSGDEVAAVRAWVVAELEADHIPSAREIEKQLRESRTKKNPTGATNDRRKWLDQLVRLVQRMPLESLDSDEFEGWLEEDAELLKGVEVALTSVEKILTVARSASSKPKAATKPASRVA